MIKKATLVLVLFLIFTYAGSQKLTILHTNDLHARLLGYGPENEYSPFVTGNDKTIGGFSRLAALIRQVKSENKGSSLIFDSGDFHMGTLFQAAEPETGFQLNLMKKMGYDLLTIGNHEFDFGIADLVKTINSGIQAGGIPQMVASNFVFNDKLPDDDGLKSLFDKNVVKPFQIIEKNGIKIGVFGLLGIDAADVAPAAKPLVFEKPVKAAERMVKFLKQTQNPDVIILLSHCGLNKKSDNTGYEGEDIEIARKVPGIDLILSGHSHVSTREFIKEGNTYIVQTGGNTCEANKISFEVRNKSITDFNFTQVPIDDNIMGDPEIEALIQKQAEKIRTNYLEPVGLKYYEAVGKTRFDLKIDYKDLKASNLGPFIADASLNYLKQQGNASDFSIVASGIIRDNIQKGMNGILTVPDIFRVMSLGKGYDGIPGYPLAKIYITGHEVKQMMEALLMSREKGGDGFIYFSGIKTEVNPKKGFLKKVQKIYVQGKEIDLSKKDTRLYSVSANTYLLSFISRIKKMSFGLLKVVPKDVNGMPVGDIKNHLVDINPNLPGVQEAKEWISMIEFMKTFKKDTDGIPVIPDKYLKPDETVVTVGK